MSTVTSEAGERIQVVRQKQQKERKRQNDGLTCSEAEVEAILSEGESA
jgi:hypothetical protein